MIVGVEDLQNYMSDITLTLDQIAAAADVIAGVQSEVETFLNRPIETGSFTEALTSDGNGYLFPTRTPIASVSSILSNNAPLSGWTLENSSISIGLIDAPVTVTYTAGLDGVNIAILRLTVLRVAAREMQNNHDDTLSVKDLGTHDVAPLPEGLQDEDRKRIERYRRRVAI